MTDDAHYDVDSSKPETAAEALARWDDGKIVGTVEMGGFGPGYEQAIHVAAFELIREGLTLDRPTDLNDDAGWQAFAERLDKLPHSWMHNLGLSGAQYGAAFELAAKTLCLGWRRAVELAPNDRHILVSRAWPHVEQPVHG
jgi:hypothetical protein